MKMLPYTIFSKQLDMMAYGYLSVLNFTKFFFCSNHPCIMINGINFMQNSKYRFMRSQLQK